MGSDDGRRDRRNRMTLRSSGFHRRPWVDRSDEEGLRGNGRGWENSDGSVQDWLEGLKDDGGDSQVDCNVTSHVRGKETVDMGGGTAYIAGVVDENVTGHVQGPANWILLGTIKETEAEMKVTDKLSVSDKVVQEAKAKAKAEVEAKAKAETETETETEAEAEAEVTLGPAHTLGEVNPFLLGDLDFTPAFWEIVEEMGVPSSWHDEVLVRQDRDDKGKSIGVEKKVSRISEIEAEGSARGVPMIPMVEMAEIEDEVAEGIRRSKLENELQLELGEDEVQSQVTDKAELDWVED